MSDRRAGWLLVIVSGALALVVCLVAYSAVYARAAVQGSSSAGEAAIALLVAAAPGIVMVVTIDVVALVVGKEDLRVRIAGAAVAVLTVVGVLVAGAIAAERTDPPASAYWAAAGYAPGPFDCAALNTDTPAAMQAALDELDHPGLTEIYFAADDSCAAMLPGVSPAEAIDSYEPQLEREGWTIEQNTADWLQAERSGYRLWVIGCWPDTTQSAVAIFVDSERFGLSCADSPE